MFFKASVSDFCHSPIFNKFDSPAGQTCHSSLQSSDLGQQQMESTTQCAGETSQNTCLHQNGILRCLAKTIGIGDGGNEIGMGKIPHETIIKNITNGDLIHCRVPTDYLIVAGVSNWGAYALAAGIFILRGVKPPPDLFNPDSEREILELIV